MDELELKILKLIKMKAVKEQQFDIAASIRNAERLIKKYLDDKLAQHILNNNK